MVSRGLQRGGWAGKSGSGAAARAGCGCTEMRCRLFPEIQRRIARMVCASLVPVGVVAPCSPLPSNREGMPCSRPGGPALHPVSGCHRRLENQRTERCRRCRRKWALVLFSPEVSPGIRLGGMIFLFLEDVEVFIPQEDSCRLSVYRVFFFNFEPLRKQKGSGA